MWPRLAAVALVVQGSLLSIMQLPLTSEKEGPHVSGLARASCSSHLRWYFSPNASTVFLPICSFAEPRRLLQKFEMENVTTEDLVEEARCLAEEDTITMPIAKEDRPIWWTMHGATIAVTGLTVAPLLMGLRQMPRTLVHFLLTSTVLLYIASLVANYFILSTEFNLERMRLMSTVALIVMGSASGLQLVAGVLLPFCLLAWPTGLTMAVAGVHLAKKPLAPALVATAIVAWLTFLGFYIRSESRRFEKPAELRGRPSKLPKEPSNITKRSRSATPPPRAAETGGA